MGSQGIKAITFDLWDTVFIDESDEPRRKLLKLLPKPVARRALVKSYLDRHAEVAREKVDLAYDTADAAFRLVWYGQNVTWTVRERLTVILSGLQRTLPPDEMDELVSLHETMELEVSPDLVIGVEKALPRLAGHFRLGVISDAIFSPGWALRRLLENYRLAHYFSAFVFSDEMKASKPDPRTFQEAARLLGVDVKEIIHVGDREEKDVVGPHGVGAKAIFLTAAKDRGSADTRADAVCRDYSELEGIIDRIARS